MVRLAFAVQVLLDPELLVVDEALAVGDVFFQQKCFRYMRDLKERGCSFLIVSHDVSAIQQFCDRGIVLVEGQKFFEGVSKDAIREYHLTQNKSHKRTLTLSRTDPPEHTWGDAGDWKGPVRWLDYDSTNTISKGNAPARLTRWCCTDDSGEIVDHFLPGEKIRFFVEFECAVSVREASAAFAVRDKTGQLIHAKHQYQIGLGTKICLEPTFLLQCEFSFDCRLTSGEYTVEFGLVDIGSRPGDSINTEAAAAVQEFVETLCYPPAVGKFSVIAARLDPIRRHGHFGLVDVEAETRFRAARSGE